MLQLAGCSNNDQGNIRLVNGTSPLEGRIEICNNRQWGTVCDDSWGNADVNVACRQLGFSGTGKLSKILSPLQGQIWDFLYGGG